MMLLMTRLTPCSFSSSAVARCCEVCVYATVAPAYYSAPCSSTSSTSWGPTQLLDDNDRYSQGVMALESLMLCGILYQITGVSVELDAMGQSHS